jgi:hypothetical protein
MQTGNCTERAPAQKLLPHEWMSHLNVRVEAVANHEHACAVQLVPAASIIHRNERSQPWH